MDIVKHISKHTESLEEQLIDTTIEQRIRLAKSILSFFFLLPDVEDTVKRHLKIGISKEQVLEDIGNRKVEEYQQASAKSIEEVDPYSEEYEDPEQIELAILGAFDHATSDLEVEEIKHLFIGVIDVLDYCEEFSDDPKRWNVLLENEVPFQLELIKEVKLKDQDSLSYINKYNKVSFNNI